MLLPCFRKRMSDLKPYDLQWKAKDPTLELPFVCITRCKKDFVWFPKLQRWVK